MSQTATHSSDQNEHEHDLEREILRRTWGRVRHLRVRVTEGQVHIRGFCSSYYDKQLALQAILERDVSLGVVLDIDVVERSPRQFQDEAVFSAS